MVEGNMAVNLNCIFKMQFRYHNVPVTHTPFNFFFNSRLNIYKFQNTKDWRIRQKKIKSSHKKALLPTGKNMPGKDWNGR